MDSFVDHPIELHDLEQGLVALRRLEAVGAGGELIIELHRFANQLAALTVAKVGAFAREGGYRAEGALSMNAWLRHHCHLSANVASTEVRTARRLAEMPATGESFARGDISLTHAAIVTRTVDEVGNRPNPDYRGPAG